MVTFPNEWKKVVVVYKKSYQQILKNYCPIFLLPVYDKTFEKIIFNKMFKYFIKSDFISLDQSGFKPGDSTINQLLSIAQYIYNSFDCVCKSRGVFLDISKTFNNVWHDVIIIKQNGISRKLHKNLHDFSVNKKQSVVSNGKYPHEKLLS